MNLTSIVKSVAFSNIGCQRKSLLNITLLHSLPSHFTMRLMVPNHSHSLTKTLLKQIRKTLNRPRLNKNSTKAIWSEDEEGKCSLLVTAKTSLEWFFGPNLLLKYFLGIYFSCLMFFMTAQLNIWTRKKWRSQWTEVCKWIRVGQTISCRSEDSKEVFI